MPTQKQMLFKKPMLGTIPNAFDGTNAPMKEVEQFASGLASGYDVAVVCFDTLRKKLHDALHALATNDDGMHPARAYSTTLLVFDACREYSHDFIFSDACTFADGFPEWTVTRIADDLGVDGCLDASNVDHTLNAMAISEMASGMINTNNLAGWLAFAEKYKEKMLQMRMDDARNGELGSN